MFCQYCGAVINEDAKFCGKCGAPIPVIVPPEPQKMRQPAATHTMAQDQRISANITFCTDGKYRWVYEMSLFKNPTIFLLIWKIFFFIFAGMFIFLTLIQSESSHFWWDGFLDNAKVFGYILIGMTVVVALGYLLYAAIMGGKYIVEFEMDEKGINHKQTASQAKKAKRLGQATMIAGAASGRIGTVGIGMNAQRTEMYSDFSKVCKAKAYPRRHLIKISERFGHNQVYAEREDFEFVKNFILSHCDRIKKENPL